MNPLTDDNPTYNWPDAKVATAFVRAVESGRLDVPYPGSGQTRQRWAVLAELAELAEEDLSLGRLAEGHTDALAILAELGALVAAGGALW